MRFPAHCVRRFKCGIRFAKTGGGAFKKRLNNNRHRSIILTRGDRYWIYEYLFAKQDRGNIDADELASFRMLAKSYAGLTGMEVTELGARKPPLEKMQLISSISRRYVRN